MRQRYLLGRYTREKYAINATLLSADYVPGEVYVQSTDVQRTMQSGYSELMGIYPPTLAKAPEMTSGEQQALQEGGRGMPGISVSNSTAINEELGVQALPNGFVSVPIFTFVEKTT